MENKQSHIFELLWRSACEVLLLLEADGRIVEVNDAAIAAYGYDRETLLAMSLPDLDHGKSGMTAEAQLCCGSLEVVHTRKDGSSFPAELKFCEIIQDRHRQFFLIVRDISDHKKLENELLYLSYAIEQSPSIVVITDLEGNIEYVNPKFSEMTGYSREEAIGENPRVLKSGEQPVEVYRELWEIISKGGEWRGEFHNKKKDGELYWETAAISAIRDTDGKITKYLAVKEDITARKEAETALRRAEALLRQEVLLAGNIQRQFLPPDLSNEKLMIHTIFEPYILVSGDTFDFFFQESANKLTGYIVDVMGHGVSTALQTSALRVLGRQVLEQQKSLQERIEELNRISSSCFTEDSFAALIAFEFDFNQKILTYVSAGINYFLANTHRFHGTVKTPGTFIGMLPDASYEQHTIAFQSGDSFYFLSDGLFDVFAGSNQCRLNNYTATVARLRELARSESRTDDATAVLIEIK